MDGDKTVVLQRDERDQEQSGDDEGDLEGLFGGVADGKAEDEAESCLLPHEGPIDGS